MPPTKLAALVTREAVRRSQVDPDDIGMVVVGNVIHSEPKDIGGGQGIAGIFERL